MPRNKEPFSIYFRKPAREWTQPVPGRKRRKLKGYFYFRTYDENDQLTVGQTTGKTTRSEAEEFCKQLFLEGRLGAKPAPTLESWVKERKWFVWDGEKPECAYTQGRLKRSSKETPAVGKGYISRCHSALETYILPIFGTMKLDRILPKNLEGWLDDLADGMAIPGKGPLSFKTVNNIASVFRIMMGEAARLDIIRKDPWEKVPAYTVDSKKRSSLSTGEAIKLMNPRTMGTVWKGHRLYYLANLTAMLTAMREGEVLALRKQDLFPTHVMVDGTYSLQYHTRGKTKTKTVSTISIPQYLYDALTAFAEWGGYIFSFNGGKTPASCNNVLNALYDAMGRIGISREEADRRGIKFHSWRRFNNTYLRVKNVPDTKVRAQTGHATEEMTDHYTDFSVESFKEVAQAQADLIGELLQEPVTDTIEKAS